MAYFAGDDYLYYAGDSQLGRYGPIAGTPQFSDNFLGAQGGTPLNTYSLSLASASSMYATAADSASLSQTSNITLEAFFKATSLPSSGNTMALVAKWDESTNKRSYMLDIATVSNYFGSGGDGVLTISSNTTEAPIDSACTGTAATQTLTATNASFAANQIIYIHQSQGTNAGIWEKNTIQSYTAGTITTGTALKGTYTTGAQVRVLKQYSAVTISTGFAYTSKAWNGTVGGIIGWLCNGTTTINGTVTAKGKGFRGASARPDNGTPANGGQGEGTSGVRDTLSTSANGNGGGGGSQGSSSGSVDPQSGYIGGGGGGGNGAAGVVGGVFRSATGGAGGLASGSSDLTTSTFGGGGGRAGAGNSSGASGGGNGGGLILPWSVTITTGGSGSINCNGDDADATSYSGSNAGGGGGGGGSVLFKAQTATLGTVITTATGGTGKTATGSVAWAATASGGDGGTGRIHIDYLTSYTGTTSPTLNPTQDNTLGSTVGYAARLGISSTGTNSEFLQQTLTGLTTGTWNRISVSWVASTSTATFYLNGVALGTSVGTLTAIHDNNTVLYIGADKGAAAVEDFYNGLIDDVRIWSVTQTAANIASYNQMQLSGTEAGLVAYYSLNNSYSDVTANANNLTGVNSPTFSTDVPFPAATTYLNIDSSYTTTGSTYALAAAISEAANDSLSFTPTNDPQQSVDFNIAAKGTGNWTVTVHDQQNVVIASKTIANASLGTGYQMFTFSTPWRIVIGKTYHMHLTSTVADGTIVSSSSNNINTGDYHTYFSFLVTDTAFHPIIPYLNFIAIGNERYVAKWDGALYYPNLIALPVGWRVRCFGYWREYLAIGVWKGSNIYDYDNGRVYFWDGISGTFNFFIDVPDGQINALFGKDSDLYMFAGYRGELLDYQGGFFYNTGNSQSLKLKRISKISRSDYTEIYPGALTMWRDLLHFGVVANSNSTTIERGVYAWGSLNQLYPATLSYDYPISTGNRGNTVSIGMVYPVGTKLIIGWQDGIAYGADVIDFTNPPASSGTIESIVQDDNSIWKTKINLAMDGDYLPLASGESVAVKFRVDRATNWTTNTTDSTVGSTSQRMEIGSGRGREYQVAVDLFATGSTSPTLLGVSLYRDDGAEESVF